MARNARLNGPPDDGKRGTGKAGAYTRAILFEPGCLQYDDYTAIPLIWMRARSWKAPNAIQSLRKS